MLKDVIRVRALTGRNGTICEEESRGQLRLEDVGRLRLCGSKPSASEETDCQGWQYSLFIPGRAQRRYRKVRVKKSRALSHLPKSTGLKTI